jgi:phage FluMu gp28-like protein
VSSYHVGLDLGQAADYTAIAVVEWTPDALKVRHLQRFQLGTVYPAIVDEVEGLMSRLPGSPELAVDATGVGRPVVDLLTARGLRLYAITITGGDTATHDGMNWRIPKRDLVGAVAVALQTGRLKIASGLPDASTLTRELLNFKVTIDPKTAHDSYSSWRESDHDDLVLAVALAVWSAERFGGCEVITDPFGGRPRPVIPTMGGWNPRDGIPRM